MSATTTAVPAQLSNRDRAVLRAIAEGRCQVAGGRGTSLVIDGRYCCDQFVGARLANAGLVAYLSSTPALTPTGLAALRAAWPRATATGDGSAWS
jgi:hypothetical protein